MNIVTIEGSKCAAVLKRKWSHHSLAYFIWRCSGFILARSLKHDRYRPQRRNPVRFYPDVLMLLYNKWHFFSYQRICQKLTSDPSTYYYLVFVFSSFFKFFSRCLIIDGKMIFLLFFRQKLMVQTFFPVSYFISIFLLRSIKFDFSVVDIKFYRDLLLFLTKTLAHNQPKNKFIANKLLNLHPRLLFTLKKIEAPNHISTVETLK